MAAVDEIDDRPVGLRLERVEARPTLNFEVFSILSTRLRFGLDQRRRARRRERNLQLEHVADLDRLVGRERRAGAADVAQHALLPLALDLAFRRVAPLRSCTVVSMRTFVRLREPPNFWTRLDLAGNVERGLFGVDRFDGRAEAIFAARIRVVEARLADPATCPAARS